MALKAALALWNIIDANNYHQSNETEDLVESLNSNAGTRISILTLSTNSHKNVDLHDNYNAIRPMCFDNLIELPSFVKNYKRIDPETQLIRVQVNADDIDNDDINQFEKETPQQNEEINKFLNTQTIHQDLYDSVHLQSESSQKLYYQGRNMLELDVHLRTSWMSFNTAQMNCNTLSVEDFLLNRGQISRIADMWPPECHLKNCTIKDCAFAEYLYQ